MIPIYTLDTPILSYRSRGDRDRTYQAFVRRIPPRNPHYTEWDICSIILPTYATMCEQYGLDWFVVAAQMAKETDWLRSWWAKRERRNPAGIGVTGRWSIVKPKSGIWVRRWGIWFEGLSFDTWAGHAIPMHVGRLLGYALRDDEATPSQRTLIDRALALRSLPPHYRGAARRWGDLSGRWAPSESYADQIIEIANAFS